MSLQQEKRRLNGNENIDLCGIPANRLEAYTNTLVNSGYNVAIANAVDGKYQVINKNYENTSTSNIERKSQNLLSEIKQENINKSAEQPISKAINLFDIAEQTEGSASEHLSIDEVAVDVENSNTDNIATNFVITSDNSVTGAKTKFKNNFEAISTLKTLEAENRAATEEEKQILSLYSGWGGLAQANIKGCSCK